MHKKKKELRTVNKKIAQYTTYKQALKAKHTGQMYVNKNVVYYFIKTLWQINERGTIGLGIVPSFRI